MNCHLNDFNWDLQLDASFLLKTIKSYKKEEYLFIYPILFLLISNLDFKFSALDFKNKEVAVKKKKRKLTRLLF